MRPPLPKIQESIGRREKTARARLAERLPVLAAAHDFACLRVDRPVAGKPSCDGRKTGYRLAGLTPSPDGIRTRWTTTSLFGKDAPPFIPVIRHGSVALRKIPDATRLKLIFDSWGGFFGWLNS
jgi:hypothetical protein